MKKEVKIEDGFKPFPEIVDPDGNDWAVSADGGKPHIAPALNQMFVPLTESDRDRGIRNHEMAHVRFSPKDPEKAIPKELNVMGVQAFEDIRMNYLLNRIGIETPSILSKDEIQRTARAVALNPYMAGLAYIAGTAWGGGRSEDGQDHDGDRIHIEASRYIEELYDRDIEAGVDPVLADKAQQRRANALANAIRAAYNVKNDTVNSVIQERRDIEAKNRRRSKNKITKHLSEIYGFDTTLAAAMLYQTLIDPRAGDPAKEKESSDGSGDSGDTGEGLAGSIIDELGDGETVKRMVAKAKERAGDSASTELRRRTGSDGVVLDGNKSIGDWPEDQALSGEWGEATMRNPPLPLKLPARLRGKKWRSTDAGAIPLSMHRAAIDNKVFGSKRLKRGGGSVLIDVSGSMHLREEDILALMAAMPGTIVAHYCGRGSRGEITVVARNGWRARDEVASERMGAGNIIDGPALAWLCKQPWPRYWVCDGFVTGKNDDGHHYLKPEALRLQKRGRIRRFHDAAQCVAFLESELRKG